jgi:hypothetical protein
MLPGSYDVISFYSCIATGFVVDFSADVAAIFTVLCLLLKLPHKSNTGNTVRYNNITMTSTE